MPFPFAFAPSTVHIAFRIVSCYDEDKVVILMKTKPIIWKSILSAAIGLAIWTIVGILVAAALSIAAGMLLTVPLISSVLIRGGDPTFLVLSISVATSFTVSIKLVEKICKHNHTSRLAFIILGISLLVIHVCYLFANLFLDGGGSALGNALNIVCGLLLVREGREKIQPDIPEDELELDPERELEPEPARTKGPQSLMWHSVIDGMTHTQLTDRYIHIKDLQYAADYFGVDLDTALILLNEDRMNNGMLPFELLKV